MLQGAAVCSSGEGSHDALLVDAAQVWQSEAMAVCLRIQLGQADATLNQESLLLPVDIQDAGVVVEVQHPRAGAGQVARRVAAANCDEPLATSAGEVDDLLDLLERFGLDVEFWARDEGLCPGMVQVFGRGAERHVRVRPVELDLEFVHGG